MTTGRTRFARSSTKCTPQTDGVAILREVQVRTSVRRVLGAAALTSPPLTPLRRLVCGSPTGALQADADRRRGRQHGGGHPRADADWQESWLGLRAGDGPLSQLAEETGVARFDGQS